MVDYQFLLLFSSISKNFNFIMRKIKKFAKFFLNLCTVEETLATNTS